MEVFISVEVTVLAGTLFMESIRSRAQGDEENRSSLIQSVFSYINPLNAELNPICYLLALLGAHHFLHVSRIRLKASLTLRLMSYIYGAPILNVSRSHTTTHHSR